VRFVLELADQNGTNKSLYARYIDPKHNPSERHWLEDSVDLHRFAGQDITLLLSTDGGPKGNTDCDWAGWGGLSFGKEGGSPQDAPALKLVYDGEAKLYEYTQALPRAALYQSVRSVPDEQAALRILSDDTSDVTDRPVIIETQLLEDEKESFRGLSSSASLPATAAEIVGYDSQTVRIRTTTDKNSMLVLTDSFFPGWKVYVDGQRRTMLQAQFMFRGVILRKGSHVVEFRYEPFSVAAGTSISISALFITIALAFVNRRRTKQQAQFTAML